MGRFNSLVWMSLRNASDMIAADRVNFGGLIISDCESRRVL